MIVAIKIDSDGARMRRAEFDNRVKTILRIYGATLARVRTCRTKRGHHIYVNFRSKTEPSAAAIVAMQAILGSDGRRELFNLERLAAGSSSRWNVLFAAKWRAGVLVSRETHVTERIIRLPGVGKTRNLYTISNRKNTK